MTNAEVTATRSLIFSLLALLVFLFRGFSVLSVIIGITLGGIGYYQARLASKDSVNIRKEFSIILEAAKIISLFCLVISIITLIVGSIILLVAFMSYMFSGSSYPYI